MKKIIFFLLLCISTVPAFAGEDPNTVEMADVMRSNGKIFVVLAVALIILIGLILYLISIDRKVSKLEKEFQRDKK